MAEMKHLRSPESWRDPPEFIELTRLLAEVRTPQQRKEAMENIKRTVESKISDKIQGEQEEDVRLFLQYCDSVSEEGANDPRAFIAEMRRIWGILTKE